VLVLFQPHRYTRTRDLMEEFAGAFGDADGVQVLDIYAASEQPIAGVTGETLAAAVRARWQGTAGGKKVMYAATMAEGVERLVADARQGDLVLTLGAGSVSQCGPMLLQALEARAW
jgi:UDP-N-acetylmuramate--alanine ligase